MSEVKKFSQALNDDNKVDVINGIVAKLGEGEGKAFMDALLDRQYTLARIRRALASNGIRVATSTLALYRNDKIGPKVR